MSTAADLTLDAVRVGPDHYAAVSPPATEDLRAVREAVGRMTAKIDREIASLYGFPFADPKH